MYLCVTTYNYQALFLIVIFTHIRVSCVPVSSLQYTSWDYLIWHHKINSPLLTLDWRILIVYIHMDRYLYNR